MRETGRNLPNQESLAKIIFFYTSTVQLTVDRHPTTQSTAEDLGQDDLPSDHFDMGRARYAVCSVDSAILDYVCLDPAWRSSQPDKLTFIALFVHEDRYPPVFAVVLTKPSEYLKRMRRECYHPGKYPDPQDFYGVTTMAVELDGNGVARRVAVPEENVFCTTNLGSRNFFFVPRPRDIAHSGSGLAQACSP